MIRYRPFRNTDPPHLAEIWRTQPPERGLMQPVSVDVLSQLVLAKPYFDNAGLIVAVADDVPVGFAHAAFGPSEDGKRLNPQLGVTCLVMVRPNYQRQGIGAELLARSEAYLRQRGARVLYGGAPRPLDAFYLGLYGGSELPGVLDSTPRAQQLFLAAGYQEVDRTLVLHRDLAAFRAPIGRHQVQIRRRSILAIVCDPPVRNWWEACTWGGFDRTRFDLIAQEQDRCIASATFWSIYPLALSWGVQAAGLIELEVDPQHARQGLATYLLGEAFRHLQQEHFSLVEVQIRHHNAAAIGLYKKLGFVQVDQGAVYRKEVS